jgi:hypothetical protein
MRLPAISEIGATLVRRRIAFQGEHSRAAHLIRKYARSDRILATLHGRESGERLKRGVYLTTSIVVA